MRANFVKAQWIAQQMEEGTNPDDVYDVLLGNIVEPTRFTAQVEGYSTEYDDDFAKRSGHARKHGFQEK